MSTQTQLPVHKRSLLSDDKPPLFAPGDLQFVFATFIIFGLRLLPASKRSRFLIQMSQGLGAIWHKSNMQDVRRVRNHLNLLFPESHLNGEIEAIVRQQLGLTIWNFMTLNLIPTLTHEQSVQLLPVEGLEKLKSLRQQGKPVLLLGAHVGPYAYPIASVLQANSFEVYEVGHVRPRQGSSRLYRRLYWPRIKATCQFMQVIDPLKGGQAELFDVIRQGKILFLLPDQLYILSPETPRSAHLVPINYLGHTVNLETGGLRLCKRFDATVFTALPQFVDDQYRITIEPFTLPTSGLSPGELTEDLQQFMNKVQSHIEEQPFLWRDLRRADLLPRLGITERT